MICKHVTPLNRSPGHTTQCSSCNAEIVWTGTAWVWTGSIDRKEVQALQAKYYTQRIVQEARNR